MPFPQSTTKEGTMAQTAIVVFTARSLDEILRDGGSRDWRLDSDRASGCHYLVCTQNRRNTDFGAPTAPHGAAFLIGRISGVVTSPDDPARWLIKISEYTECIIPNTWGKSGHLRYPVWYTTLEDLGIDMTTLPPFTALLPPLPRGMREMAAAPLIASAWTPRPTAQTTGGNQADPWRRLDAILAQLDRVPDLATPADTLDWDEHGLPR
jgi:hypothetical protein